MPRSRFATASMPLLVVFVLTLAAGGADSQQAPAPAPAPAGGCNLLLAKAADCLQYLAQGIPASQPPDKCCAGVKRVFKDPEAVACVCDLIGGHTSGLPINLTRAAGLPAACGAAASPLTLSQCGATSPTPAAPTGQSAAIESPVTAGLLVAVLVIAGYHF